MSVVETRWFRNEKWADTLWMLALSKIETLSVETSTVTVFLAVCKVGIKVYVDDVLISGVDPVATVEYASDEKEVLKSATWLCPETDISGKYVKVQIWVFVGTDYERCIAGCAGTFRTEVFENRKLDLSEWTVYYTCSYTAIVLPLPKSSIDFHFDGAFLSRIEGFAHSPIVIPKRIQMDGLVMFLT